MTPEERAAGYEIWSKAAVYDTEEKIGNIIATAISEAVAEETERCVSRLEQMQEAAHQLSDFGEESTLSRAIAAIRAPREAE